ncbi:Hypothetical predicted protein [Octopus vulgaris]|uniref:Uncharacterized protein n=1 Tax=Octopus vulgaris TaxID=6645 RepID=A0AA36B4Y6_OCTVU|nr:Hypothetical predicted protein [Octopus vulgaris]
MGFLNYFLVEIHCVIDGETFSFWPRLIRSSCNRTYPKSEEGFRQLQRIWLKAFHKNTFGYGKVCESE